MGIVKKMGNAKWVLLLFLLLILVRLPFSEPVIDTDQGKYLLDVDYPGNGLITPLFYQMTLWGFSLWAMSLLSVLFSFGIGVLLYFFLRRENEFLARIGLLIYALHPGAVLFAKAFYLDLYVSFFWMLALFLFYQIRDGKKGVLFFGVYYLAILCAGLVKPQGIAIIGLLVLLLFFERKSAFGWLKENRFIVAVLPFIPFLLDWLANPIRLSDFLKFLTDRQEETRGLLENVMGGLERLFLIEGALLVLGVIGVLWLIFFRKGLSEREGVFRGTVLGYVFTFLFLLFILGGAKYHLTLLAPFTAMVLSYCVFRSFTFFGKEKRNFVCILLGLLLFFHLGAVGFMESQEMSIIQEFREELVEEINGESVVVLEPFGHEYQYFLEGVVFKKGILDYDSEVKYVLKSELLPVEEVELGEEFVVRKMISRGEKSIILYERE